ncbi:3-keto-disaccharide hydrolase [Pontibacter akesuensis]|uniref:3-keto-alpha-glucoside-1,2-lyase/3-keto-2-hydroxy-glucal hydratase domain-containing protein n=1 Tax=Pontibacter akesuensis TaxID=388950 RepID=A0A1I7GRD3_9BACT|nr:DUF1080 domain-containing protein [Pontibacter akesuensis]GHA55476.1 glycosyl hydrolase [Pontibacter akesuensis]SFU50998.1 protein of unknown function [Pontibacter akesuensis]
MTQQVEWKPLFDGKSTHGWHSYGQSEAGDAWQVQDGALYLNSGAIARDGAIGGDLVTDASYGDFHLKLEWKIARGGNSGLLFYVQEEPGKYEKSWQSGPGIQLLDNALHADAMIPKRRAGDLYDLLSSSKESVNPAGEWNQLEIRCEAGKLQVYLNGEETLTLQLWNEAWQELIRNSKFKDMPDFGTFKSGKIALQDHGDAVWFRSIFIREI